MRRCPNCGAGPEYLRVNEDGNLVCTRCGYVIDDFIMDTGPEWRAYTPEDRTRRSRVGAPITERVHDRGLTTFIQVQVRDERARKLARIHQKVRKAGSEKLIQLLQEANNIAARMGLPSRVAEEFTKIVRFLYEQKLLRRSNMTTYLAAALVAAARIAGYAITMRDVARFFELDVLQVWSAYRSIVARLRVRPRPPCPEEFIPLLTSRLGLPTPVECLATRFVKELAKRGITQGKPPKALAAAAVYLASILLDEKRNQTQVARAADVTDATIRNRYRDIVDNFYVEVRL